MSLEETLLTELKALRAGSGLTEARLRQQVTLTKHLGAATVKESFKALVKLVGEISDTEQRIAVKYAFGLEGPTTRQTKERRAAAVKVLSLSLRTLDRRELDGCEELARIIIECSPNLTEVERQDEIDHSTSTAKRLADLEFMVLVMARGDKLAAKDPNLEPGWRKFWWPSWFRKLEDRHWVAREVHSRDIDKFDAKFNALLERVSDEDAVKAWKARFVDDQHKPTNRWEKFLDEL
ncbi:hypothetical protein ACFUN8_32995 [Streptomyces sp. NPDC057307]|uniref:hypothetical protein n=1 Tax=Streptomyces sp. NPDC057307 TaxID=3346096 RepID=UPI0036363D81